MSKRCKQNKDVVNVCHFVGVLAELCQRGLVEAM